MPRFSRDILIGFLRVRAAGWGLLGICALHFADQSLDDTQAR